ncbi:MAG: cysteine hydrolase family protein [Acidobacteriaceae bacterium]|nr:cysteine hydrolase family protein [Acidobacteriaceae bacterium]
MKTVFVDVDTQLDFLFPAGALAVAGAASMVNSLAELTRMAAAKRIPLISTMDAHSGNDPEFKVWKPHCVVGTVGQQKAAATLLGRRFVLPTAAKTPDEIHTGAPGAEQIIIEKQTIDCFTNPNLRPLLDFLHADRYVVYGVVTEVCVRCAAFGLLQSGARVELVSDAIKSLSETGEREVLQRFQAQGGVLTTISAIT